MNKAKPSVLSGTTLAGINVKNDQDSDLGEIKDVMIDMEEGQVAYVVLSFGGFMGMGDKLFAIPWEGLEFDASKDCFILNVSKNTLKNAEGFDHDDWPDFTDREWGNKLFLHYGYEPYWKTETIETS